MQFTMVGLKKLTNEELMFLILYLIGTLLGVIVLLILLSVYNKSDFFFLKTTDLKFYGLFLAGFTMCAIVMFSAINYSGWNDIFVILSSILGIALLTIFVMFILNINFLFLSSKDDFIYTLGALIFLKVGIATFQRVIVFFT